MDKPNSKIAVVVEDVDTQLEQAEKATSVEELSFPPLSDKDMAQADKWAKQLVPDTEGELMGVIDLGEAELAPLSGTANAAIDTIRNIDMEAARKKADEIQGRVKKLDLADLSPVPRRILLVVEDIEAIMRRVEKFFHRYEKVKKDFARDAAALLEVETAQAESLETLKQHAKEKQEALRILRILVVAGEKYLHDYGNPTEAAYQKEADEEIARAKLAKQIPDSLILNKVEDLRAYNKRVGLAIDHWNDNIVHSFQASVSSRMLRESASAIMQVFRDLRNDVLMKLPDLTLMTYTAFQQMLAADLGMKRKEIEREMREQAATSMEDAGEGLIKLLEAHGFDRESYQRMNDALKAFDLALEKAFAAVEKAREADVQFGRGLVTSLAESRAAVAA